jgi:hypothetical protein
MDEILASKRSYDLAAGDPRTAADDDITSMLAAHERAESLRAELADLGYSDAASALGADRTLAEAASFASQYRAPTVPVKERGSQGRAGGTSIEEVLNNDYVRWGLFGLAILALVSLLRRLF